MTNGAAGTRSAGEIVIRQATVADATALAGFAAHVFRQAFGPDNDPADMQVYLADTFTPEQQTAEIADPTCVYLIAELGEAMAGEAMAGEAMAGEAMAGEAMAGEAMAGYALLRVGSIAPCVSGARPVEIQRFYVDHGWHGRGLAARLMAACIDVARARGGETVWLGVWERNARAIRFYAKHGFTDVGTHEFRLGRDVQTDRVLSRPVMLSR